MHFSPGGNQKHIKKDISIDKRWIPMFQITPTPLNDFHSFCYIFS